MRAYEAVLGLALLLALASARAAVTEASPESRLLKDSTEVEDFTRRIADCAASCDDPCPGGVSCTDCDEDGTRVCAVCDGGTYSPVEDQTCHTCPAGKASSAGTAQCDACPDGQISEEGSKECSNTAADQASSDEASNVITNFWSAPGSNDEVCCEVPGHKFDWKTMTCNDPQEWDSCGGGCAQWGECCWWAGDTSDGTSGGQLDINGQELSQCANASYGQNLFVNQANIECGVDLGNGESSYNLCHTSDVEKSLCQKWYGTVPGFRCTKTEDMEDTPLAKCSNGKCIVCSNDKLGSDYEFHDKANPLGRLDTTGWPASCQHGMCSPKRIEYVEAKQCRVKNIVTEALGFGRVNIDTAQYKGEFGILNVIAQDFWKVVNAEAPFFMNNADYILKDYPGRTKYNLNEIKREGWSVAKIEAVMTANSAQLDNLLASFLIKDQELALSLSGWASGAVVNGAFQPSAQKTTTIRPDTTAQEQAWPFLNVSMGSGSCKATLMVAMSAVESPLLWTNSDVNWYQKVDCQTIKEESACSADPDCTWKPWKTERRTNINDCVPNSHQSHGPKWGDFPQMIPTGEGTEYARCDNCRYQVDGKPAVFEHTVASMVTNLEGALMQCMESTWNDNTTTPICSAPIEMQVSTNLVTTAPEECRDWFPRVDNAIRARLAALRNLYTDTYVNGCKAIACGLRNLYVRKANKDALIEGGWMTSDEEFTDKVHLAQKVLQCSKQGDCTERVDYCPDPTKIQALSHLVRNNCIEEGTCHGDCSPAGTIDQPGCEDCDAGTVSAKTGGLASSCAGIKAFCEHPQYSSRLKVLCPVTCEVCTSTANTKLEAHVEVEEQEVEEPVELLGDSNDGPQCIGPNPGINKERDMCAQQQLIHNGVSKLDHNFPYPDHVCAECQHAKDFYDKVLREMDDWQFCRIRQTAFIALTECQAVCDMQAAHKQAQETQCTSMDSNDFSSAGLKKAFLCGIDGKNDKATAASAISSYDFFNLRMSPAGGWAKQQLHDILHWEDDAGYPEDDGIRTVGSITVTGRMPKYALALQQAHGNARPILSGEGDFNPHEFGLKNLMTTAQGFLNVADLSTWDETDTCTMSIKYNVTRCQTRDTETGPVLDMVQTSVMSALDTDLPAGCAKWFVRADATLRMVFAQKRLSVKCDN